MCSRITMMQEDHSPVSRKAFLYILFGFSPRISKNPQLAKTLVEMRKHVGFTLGIPRSLQLVEPMANLELGNLFVVTPQTSRRPQLVTSVVKFEWRKTFILTPQTSRRPQLVTSVVKFEWRKTFILTPQTSRRPQLVTSVVKFEWRKTFILTPQTSRRPQLVTSVVKFEWRKTILTPQTSRWWSKQMVELEWRETYIPTIQTSRRPQLEHPQRERGLVCDTVYQTYTNVAWESEGAVIRHVNSIEALVRHGYYHFVVGKALLREDPLSCISSSIRQMAMDITTSFRQPQPLLGAEDGAAVRALLSLPPADVMPMEASSPGEGQASVDLFRKILHTWDIVLQGVTEEPAGIPACLERLETWMNSHKNSERERAMWCTAKILNFTAQMNNFGVEIRFPQLGRLVSLLAICCQDPDDNISFLSSQAVSSLFCILLQQKQMERPRRKDGLWKQRGETEDCRAVVFPDDDPYKIAKAFAEYLTQIQVTDLVLRAMEGLTNSSAKVSLVAAQLMNAILKERGRDILKIEDVVQGLLDRLSLQLERSTEEETLQAMGLLAGSNPDTVVPILLNEPLPWDRTRLSLWKAFGTHHETTVSILQLFIGILQKNCPRKETSQSVAVMCALCEMLSGSQCPEAVQELYPQLLLAVLCHLYWVTEQTPPHNVVVHTKVGELGSKSKAFDHTSCAIEAVKLVMASVNDEVMSYAEEHCCWDLLSSPESYHRGIMELTSGTVKMCKPPILHQILSHVRKLLYSLDDCQKVLARAFYVQLLWHRSVAQTLGQDVVGDLIKWTEEPNRIMKELGLRGITNLSLHPEYLESVKSLVPLLGDFLNSGLQLTLLAVKSLWNIIDNGQGEDAKQVFCSIAKQLRPLLTHVRYKVRVSATSALGLMLHRIGKIHRGEAIHKEVKSFLFPLLLGIQENDVQMMKVCAWALMEWTHVTGWTKLTERVKYTTLVNHLTIVDETCTFLIKTGRYHLVGDLLTESFNFLKSPIFFLREAAVRLIGFIVRNTYMETIYKEDVQQIQDALHYIFTNDPAQCVRSMARDILERTDDNWKSELSIISRLRRLTKSVGRKKHFFKIIKQEGDEKPKKNICSCLGGFGYSLHRRRNRKDQNPPP